MTQTFDDIAELKDFIMYLMRSGGSACFRGVEVRCDHLLGLHGWTMYGPKIASFTADIGPDGLDYVCEKLVAGGILDNPRA